LSREAAVFPEASAAMSTTRVLSLSLIFPGLLLAGCAGNVSGRLDMEQNFRTGVELKRIKADHRNLPSCLNWE
jgi:hypothetical protein